MLQYSSILCVEILAIMIRENRNIKGVLTGVTKHRITQTANDTQLKQSGDRNMNCEKTLVWLGKARHCTVKYILHLSIEWNP